MSDALRWFKSSYSDSGGGNCIEVAYDWHRSSYSNDSGGQCIEVAYGWSKSSYSSASGGECVEVAAPRAAVHIRDSKNPGGAILTVAPGTWAAFVAHATR
ncbi:DUF397 domain-containing protein [Streptomyces celluloflavus]|uniref:DUF397 domain-containing protein n=1 Tax=Streptomyces celluloflavus TaxID=58344 RepID=UPI0036B9018E